MNNKREIIDIHHHIIPKIYKDALKKIGVTTAGGYPIKDWEPQDSIQMMDALNIQVGVTSISEPATLPFKENKQRKSHVKLMSIKLNLSAPIQEDLNV